MSLASTDDSSRNTPRNRVKVFVDFWNFSLSMREVDRQFRTDWKPIGKVLAQAAIEVVNIQAIAEYQGLNLYGSYDPTRDAKLLKWATTVLDIFPGVNVSMVPRHRKRSPPVCPACHQEVGTCVHCGSDMRGTEEKSVDVRMATDMISLAWADNYDIAVLVSSDRDFVPVAEFLDTRGIKVIHACFPPKGAQLTQKCWGSIDVSKLRSKFRRTSV